VSENRPIELRSEAPVKLELQAAVQPAGNGGLAALQTPAAVSIAGIFGATAMYGMAITHGLVDPMFFYISLGTVAAICGIHLRFAPLVQGSRR
jgi:hypothetical protein